MADIGKRIKARREQLNITQEELANKLGYKNKSTIAKIENGTNDIVQSKVKEFAAALNTTIAYLMDWEDTNPLPEGAIPYVPEPMVNVPLVGSVNCGTPLFAEDNIEGYIPTPESDLQTGETYFWLRAKGNSMINAGIHHGDLLLIRQQPDVDNGDIAVVAVNGDEATLKRVKKQENALILQPENPACEPKIFVGKDMENIHIRGRLMQLRKEF
ncbi:LexA family protein [Anaerotignum faecicola]